MGLLLGGGYALVVLCCGKLPLFAVKWPIFGSLGFLTTSTSRAFTRNEMEDIVKQMN